MLSESLTTGEKSRGRVQRKLQSRDAKTVSSIEEGLCDSRNLSDTADQVEGSLGESLGRRRERKSVSIKRSSESRRVEARRKTEGKNDSPNLLHQLSEDQDRERSSLRSLENNGAARGESGGYLPSPHLRQAEKEESALSSESSPDQRKHE